MGNIVELLSTKIFIVDTITDDIPSKSDGKIVYEKSSKLLKIYDKSTTSWKTVVEKAVLFAQDDNSLPSGEFEGQLCVSASNRLYAFIDSAWVAVGGGGISIVANAEALPDEAKAGDAAITSDNNVLYYYSGTKWTSTKELITIPYVYNSLGDFKAGDAIDKKTNQEMWEKLLTKEINPTITQPTASFSMSGASNNSLQEIGAELNLTFTTSFNQGNVRNAWGSNNIQSSTYAGLPNTYTFTGTGLTPSVSSTALSNQQTVNPYTVVAGAQTWTASVSYDAGTYQPKTNYNNNYSTPCPAGTKSGGTLKITGVYPTFATSVNLTTATKQALKAEPVNSSSYMTFTLAGESSTDQRQFFELPKSWSALTGVADSGGAWYNGGKSGSLTQWTMTEVQETVQGTQVDYRRYTYNGPLSAVRTIRVFTK